MARALQALEDIAPAVWRSVLPTMRESVKEGRALAATLAAADIDIPPMMIAIVHAGEAGAGLGDGIRRAADIAESAAATSASVKSALAYPMIVALAGLGAIGVLLGVVLPRFATILSGFGQTLPRSTQIVLAAANDARAGAFRSVCCWRSALSPIADGRRHRTASAVGMRCCSAPRCWARSDAPLRPAAPARRSARCWIPACPWPSRSSTPRAPRVTRPSRRASPLRGRTCLAASRSRRALEQAGAVTTTASRLIRAGEQTGRLASMLTHAAKLERDRADRAVRVGLRLLEPVLLLVFATFVAGVAASLLQAIYSVKPG